MNELAEGLRECHKILSEEDAWAQHVAVCARGRRDKPVEIVPGQRPPIEELSFCSQGVLDAVFWRNGSLLYEAFDLVAAAMREIDDEAIHDECTPTCIIIAFNDTYQRPLEDVLLAFEKAAIRAEELVD